MASPEITERYEPRVQPHREYESDVDALIRAMLDRDEDAISRKRGTAGGSIPLR